MKMSSSVAFAITYFSLYANLTDKRAFFQTLNLANHIPGNLFSNRGPALHFRCPRFNPWQFQLGLGKLCVTYESDSDVYEVPEDLWI